jgi:hypothetical protein
VGGHRLAEEPVECGAQRGGDRVVTVGLGVTAVDGGQPLQDARVDAGEIVGGEAAREGGGGQVGHGATA